MAAPQRSEAAPSSSSSSSTRPRAFDAAHAHSWHYYNPRSNASTPTLSAAQEAQRPTSVRHATTPSQPAAPVFDAANPRTWNRSTSRLLLSEQHRDRPVVRSVLDRTSARAPGHSGRVRQNNEASPRTLNDWSEYLNNADSTSTAERVAILTDVYRAMQVGPGMNTSTLAQQRRQASHRPPRSLSATGLASMLHDPDFGDTSPYWSRIVAEQHTRSRLEEITRSNAMTSHYGRRAGPSHGSTLIMTQPLSTTQQRRRRGSVTSVNTTHSQATLPEYEIGDWALPDYRSQISSRGSMEINA